MVAEWGCAWNSPVDSDSSAVAVSGEEICASDAGGENEETLGVHGAINLCNATQSPFP